MMQRFIMHYTEIPSMIQSLVMWLYGLYGMRNNVSLSKNFSDSANIIPHPRIVISDCWNPTKHSSQTNIPISPAIG